MVVKLIYIKSLTKTSNSCNDNTLNIHYSPDSLVSTYFLNRLFIL